MSLSEHGVCAPIRETANVCRSLGLSNAAIAECLSSCMEMEVSRMKVNRWMNGKVDPSWPEGEALIALCALFEYLHEAKLLPKSGHGFVPRLVDTINKQLTVEA